MKKIIMVVVAIAAVSGIAADMAVAAGGQMECGSTNLNILGMRKNLNNDWAPNTEQDELGANIDVRGAYWPVSLDLTYLYSTQKGTVNDAFIEGNTLNSVENQAITEEAGIGIKKIWTNNAYWSLFVAAGADWIKGSLSFSGPQNYRSSFDNTNVGWYASGGVYYTLLKLINLGVVVRYSDVELNLANRSFQAGGWHYGFMAGLHF